MLPKISRLCKKKDFENIFEKGRTQSSGLFRIRFVKNTLQYSRFAVVVSNKTAKLAVTRNRIRRQIREILRLNMPMIQEGYDIVFYIQKDAIGRPFEELKEQSFFVLKKSGLAK